MPDLLEKVSHEWGALSRSPAALGILERWSCREPTLADFESLHDVAVAAQGRDVEDLDARDELQFALLRIAADDEDARLAMLHILGPGLVGVTRTYAPRWGRRETEAMVTAAALDRIAGFGSRPHTRPAANIVLGVRHTLFKRRLQEVSRTDVLGRQVLFDDDVLESGDEEVPAADELLYLVGEAVRTGRITERGARLIVLHRICDMSTRAVAEDEGRDPASVRQYRNRAEAVLAEVAEAEAVA